MPIELEPIDGGNARKDTPERGPDHFDGAIVRTKTAATVLKANIGVSINWTMLDRDGAAVDLEALGLFLSPTSPTSPTSSSTSSTSSTSSNSSSSTSSFSSEAADSSIGDEVLFTMGNEEVGKTLELTGEVVSAAAGTVRVGIPAASIPTPGIYLGEFAIVQNGDVLLINQFWVILEESLTGNTIGCGPPTVAEVRLFLRDNGYNDNELIDHIDFDAAEIALATRLPVQEWNESLPPLNTSYTTQNFPFRYHWLKAICGHLFLIAAEHYRRNRLPYAAAGLSIDDKSKSQEYEQKAAQYLDEWRRFMRQKKVQLNMDNGWGYVGSPYSYD